MTERGIELIKRFEGFSSVVYICPAGYPTIGYGHVVQKGEQWDRISKEEAEGLLRKDLQKYEAGVRRLTKGIELHDWCIDALVSFAFNVGLWALKVSTLRRKILRGELFDAGEEFLRWVYAGGRVLAGLKKRRQAERALWLEGLSMPNF